MRHISIQVAARPAPRSGSRSGDRYTYDRSRSGGDVNVVLMARTWRVPYLTRTRDGTYATRTVSRIVPGWRSGAHTYRAYHYRRLDPWGIRGTVSRSY